MTLNPFAPLIPASNASFSTTKTIPGSSQVHVGFWLFHGSTFPVQICLTYLIQNIAQQYDISKYCLQRKLLTDWTFVQFPILTIPKLSKGIEGVQVSFNQMRYIS